MRCTTTLHIRVLCVSVYGEENAAAAAAATINVSFTVRQYIVHEMHILCSLGSSAIVVATVWIPPPHYKRSFVQSPTLVRRSRKYQIRPKMKWQCDTRNAIPKTIVVQLAVIFTEANLVDEFLLCRMTNNCDSNFLRNNKWSVIRMWFSHSEPRRNWTISSPPHMI